MATTPRKRQRRTPSAAGRNSRTPRRRIPGRTSATAGRQFHARLPRADWLLQKLPDRYRQKAHDILVLTRMDRPIGALLLLWPTWWALWLAGGDFPPWRCW